MNKIDALKRDWIIDNVEKGMSVLDLGAYIGEFTKIFRDAVGETGKIVAVEPETRNFENLFRSLSGKVVVPVKGAVSDENGVDYLYVQDKAKWHSLINKAGAYKKVEIMVYTVDRLADTFLQRVDVMKLDVEGYDVRVLNGAQHVLENSKDMAVIMEVHMNRFNVDNVEVFDILTANNFKIYNLLDSFKEILTAEEISEEIIALKGKFNETINSYQE